MNTKLVKHKIHDAVVVNDFSDLEKSEAKNLRITIDNLLSSLHQAENNLATSYVRLGQVLLLIKQKNYWMLFKRESEYFRSFGDYLDFIQVRINKGRAQLYSCISIAEKLLPIIKEENLVEIGISKALELKRLLKAKGSIPSKIISRALDKDVGVAELRASIFKETNFKTSSPGSYFDFGGFYTSADERKLILRAIELAKKIDPPISKEIPEWAQMKEVILRFAMEFISTYEAEEYATHR